MDHDKQVTDLVQGTRDHFLNQPLHPDDRDRDSFDLEMEFAKTAKNKSILVPLAVAVFLVLLGVGAWVASQFTEQASQKSTVSIGSFEDLKLKEIFDTARKNRADLEVVQGQISQLSQTSAARVATLQQAGASKADIASVNDASGTQAKNILAETNRQVAAEKASLEAALRPLRAQAEEIQKKIDSYDDRIGEMNKKNQQVLDSQQRLFELEKKKLTDQYEGRLEDQATATAVTVARLKKERDDLVGALKAKAAEDIRKLILKYNPVIVEPAIVAQIAAFGTSVAEYPSGALPERIASSGVLSTELQSALAARVERTRALLARFKQIPYENSVPPMLNALDNAISESLAGYNGYLAPLAQHLSYLDAQIATLEQTIAQDRVTLAQRDASIAELTGTVDGLRSELETERADRRVAEEAAATERVASEAAVAERTKASMARWKSSLESVAAGVREDGIVADPRVADDLFVVLKADRAKVIAASLAANPGIPHLAIVRDGANNAELGTVSLEVNDEGWRGRTVKVNDPRKPFKSFDRVVLSLPVKK